MNLNSTGGIFLLFNSSFSNSNSQTLQLSVTQNSSKTFQTNSLFSFDSLQIATINFSVKLRNKEQQKSITLNSAGSRRSNNGLLNEPQDYGHEHLNLVAHIEDIWHVLLINICTGEGLRL